jgi:hypothetical protein
VPVHVEGKGEKKDHLPSILEGGVAAAMRHDFATRNFKFQGPGGRKNEEFADGFCAAPIIPLDRKVGRISLGYGLEDLRVRSRKSAD